MSEQEKETMRLVSVSLPAPGLDALDFVRQAQGQARFYWNDHDPITFAGSGIATEVFAWGDNRYEAIQAQAEALFTGAMVSHGDEPLAVPRLFGGFAFRDDFVPDKTWSNFHPAHFVLPHYQLLQHGREAWLTINAQIPHDEDPAEIIPDLHAALQAKYTALVAPPPTSRTATTSSGGEAHQLNYPMSEAQWTTMIEAARAEIRTNAFQKVVLARVAEINFGEDVNVDGALTYLNLHYPECYRFLFEPRPHHAFYGATPELLVKVTNTAVTTMGMAGSTRRGATPAEDRALTLDLLNSAKDRHEHQLVVDAIERRLTPLTTSLDMPRYPQIYTLSNIHHLYTPIQGTLTDPQGVLPLVETLHPTPALGGTPREPAMRFIQAHEPVSRGWYAAPVGWLDHTLDGLFAVAIRSAVAQNNRVWAYAGAGIVADSEPAKEWAETAVKFRPMLNAVGLFNGQ